jgi:energy-coupling factor transport system permease protein
MVMTSHTVILKPCAYPGERLACRNQLGRNGKEDRPRSLPHEPSDVVRSPMAQFLSDVSIVGYVPGTSILHRLDPRTKLLSLVLLLTGVFWSRSAGGAGLTLTSVFLVAFVSGAGWRIWLWGLSRFKWMVAIALMVNACFHPTGTLIVLAGWVSPLTSEALTSCGVLAIQLLAAITLSMALTFTTTPSELTRACERLARPLRRFRIPVEDLAVVVLLAMRFVPLLQQELRNSVEAQTARGVDFRSGPLTSRAANLLAILVPALLGTLRRSELLAVAMAARAFRPGAARSEYTPLVFSWRDAASMAVVAIVLFCLVILNSLPY